VLAGDPAAQGFPSNSDQGQRGRKPSLKQALAACLNGC
jgi:hypothetical protein